MSATARHDAGAIAYVSVAANVEPERNIDTALDALARRVPIEAVSRFFITPPLERPGQPSYYNGVVRLRYVRSARALKFEVLREVEAGLGRVRNTDKYAARPIDLDLLAYGDAIIADEDLIVPDPDLPARNFLAAALLDLDPDFTIPDSGIRLDELSPEVERAGLIEAAAFTLRMKSKYAAKQRTQ